jgi:hypothetical protein
MWQWNDGRYIVDLAAQPHNQLNCIRIVQRSLAVWPSVDGEAVAERPRDFEQLYDTSAQIPTTNWRVWQ